MSEASSLAWAPTPGADLSGGERGAKGVRNLFRGLFSRIGSCHLFLLTPFPAKVKKEKRGFPFFVDGSLARAVQENAAR
jgi:hypothetical protein